MSRSIAFPVALWTVTLGCVSLLKAQEKGDSNQDNVKKEVRKLEAEWAAAVETNKPKRIERFLGKDFLFIGAGGVLQSREQHLNDFESGKLHVDSVKNEASTIHVYNGAAVVSSRVAEVGTYGKRKIDGPYLFTDTWVRLEGQWVAVARQQTAIAKSPKPEPG
jgi:hypothetical protein